MTWGRSRMDVHVLMMLTILRNWVNNAGHIGPRGETVCLPTTMYLFYGMRMDGVQMSLWNTQVLNPGSPFMQDSTGSSFVQIMACHLIGTKPLPWTNDDLLSIEQTSVKLELKFREFSFKKINFKMSSVILKPFCPFLNVLIWEWPHRQAWLHGWRYASCCAGHSGSRSLSQFPCTTPAVRTVQGDYQWHAKSGGNCHRSREPTIHCDTR